MSGIKYGFGDIVIIDPVGDGYNCIKGKVIGITTYVDGTDAYTISAIDEMNGILRRHLVSPSEMVLVKAASKTEGE